jgi:hypothetical protein
MVYGSVWRPHNVVVVPWCIDPPKRERNPPEFRLSLLRKPRDSRRPVLKFNVPGRFAQNERFGQSDPAQSWMEQLK